MASLARFVCFWYALNVVNLNSAIIIKEALSAQIIIKQNGNVQLNAVAVVSLAKLMDLHAPRNNAISNYVEIVQS